MSNIILSHDLEKEVERAVCSCPHESLFLLSDTTTHTTCVPLIRDFAVLKNAHEIVIPSGDEHKTLSSATQVWEELSREKATRGSLLINVGGGMVTDLGGFSASCFKRGISFINIPTTLLAMVDASIGGKTGVNLGALKNEVGTFCHPQAVLIDTVFLKTLDKKNFLSGYAEMLKHGLLSDEATFAELLTFDINRPNLYLLSNLVEKSLAIKEAIVEQDPREEGLRKALNVGHTIGHALESLSIRWRKPLLHGYAVAFGIVAELYLSVTKMGFPADKMRQIVGFIRENYGAAPIVCDDYDELLEIMEHDKKNTRGQINFTLLSNIGAPELNQTATAEEIKEALDFLREGF